MARKKITPESNPQPRPSVSVNRKMEIIGLLVMAIALLIAISIITFDSGDYVLVSDAGISSVFQNDTNTVGRVQNGLGIMGAYISHVFVHLFFGYISIVVPFILIQIGWSTFRHRSIHSLNWPITLWVSGMVLMATILGWVTHQSDYQMELFSGAAGLFLAQILLTVTGMYGSFVLLVTFTIVLLLLLIDRDIQVTIDRVKDLIERVRDWYDEQKNLRTLRKQQQSEVDLKQHGDRREDEVSEKVRPSEQGTSDSRKEVDVEKSPQNGLSERERWQLEQEEMKQKVMPDRALLEDDDSDLDEGHAEGTTEDGQDLKVQVFVGEEEEEARARDLEREQKAQSVPVIRYQFPTIDLLDNPPLEGNEVDFDEIEENKNIIQSKLRLHGIEIVSVNAIVGPTVTLYELQPAPDVKISKIESYANDLKMAMATRGLRIIAPIPGKSAVGIEVPNRKRQTVYIKQLINTKKFVESKMALPVAFGKTIENEVYMVDLTAMPHLLIAGATGSGKSVGINTIITCLLYKCHPESLKFVLIDPKKIELALYRHLQKHFIATLPDAEEPIVTDTSKVMEVLSSVCKEMDDRYDLLKMGMVRDIRSYNEKFKEGKLEEDLGHRHLPYIVVIIDELADLMLTAGKAIEEPIARIAQLARAVGIHLVVATQRPSVNVITGTIKANFPVRIAYQVASKIDSRTILDTMGADQLVGRGDMLVSTSGTMVRVQNAFVSTEEVERINAFIGNQLGYNKPYMLPKVEDPNSNDSGIPELDDRDELFEEAAKVVVLHQQGSVSLIQRKLKLGYNRAGRIIDQLYSAGIVGPYQGSTAREVLIADEDELYEHLRNFDE